MNYAKKIGVPATQLLDSDYREMNKLYLLTPLMLTLDEAVLTHIDLRKIIEMGLQIVKIRLTHKSLGDKFEALSMFKAALKLICDKHGVSAWPLATCFELSDGAIRTGFIDKELGKRLWLRKGNYVTITTDSTLWDKMNSKTIWVDGPNALQLIKSGCEITMCGGGVKMVPVKALDSQNIKCEITNDGNLINEDYMTICGLKKSVNTGISASDLELLALAKGSRADVIIVFAVKGPSVVLSMRKICEIDQYYPLFVSTICNKEGLENFDSILEVSDGIIIARDFLTQEFLKEYPLCAIQMHLNAKCKRNGKPFFISGGVFEDTMDEGQISIADLSDVTNACMLGCGLVLQNYNNAQQLIETIKIFNDVCKTAEITEKYDCFWRMVDEYQMPIDAAQACVLSCASLARQTQASVIVLPTTTGRTAIELTRLAPSVIIITVSRRRSVANKLQFYRGICAVVYDRRRSTALDWSQEMDARIEFAVKYCVKRDILTYGNTYVTLSKAQMTSSFPDSVGVWTVTSTHVEKNTLQCGNS